MMRYAMFTVSLVLFPSWCPWRHESAEAAAAVATIALIRAQ